MYALSIRTRFYNWLTLLLTAFADYTYNLARKATSAETSASGAAFDSETADVQRALQKAETKSAELSTLVDRLSAELAESDSHASWLEGTLKYRQGA